VAAALGDNKESSCPLLIEVRTQFSRTAGLEFPLGERRNGDSDLENEAARPGTAMSGNVRAALQVVSADGRIFPSAHRGRQPKPGRRAF